MRLKKSIRYLAAAVSVITVFSACGGGTPAQTIKTSATVPPTQAVSETPAPPVTEETTVTTTAETAKKTTTTTAETTVSEAPDTEDTEETDISETEDIVETDVTPEESTAEQSGAATEASPAQTQAAETTTTSVSVAETTSAPPAAVKHDPSPPVINKVSTDGVNVFQTEKGTVDYSNANTGYVSVKYTGSKKLSKLRITHSSGESYDYTIFPDGKYHYFTLSSGSGDYTVKLYEPADGDNYVKIAGGDISAKISDDIKLYTYANDYIWFDAGSACVAKASEVCGGCSSAVEKIAAVFGFVSENISYDYELAASISGLYTPDPDTTLKKKKGVCFDYSSLMAAMLRSQGVPTRMIVGYSLNVYHAWNEVYTPETGWVTPEILLKNKGFNLLDSTFYSTAADKGYIAEYMQNKANYSKIYTY